MTEQERLEDAAIDRMIATLDRCILIASDISVAVRGLNEMHQPEAEHFLREHREGAAHRLVFASKQLPA